MGSVCLPGGQTGRGRVTAQAGSLLLPTLTFQDQPSPLSSGELPQASFPLGSCRLWTWGPSHLPLAEWGVFCFRGNHILGTLGGASGSADCSLDS